MRNRLVLVVDSRRFCREAEVRALWLAGFDVVAASSSCDALNATRNLHPAIVVLDSYLDDRTGFDVAREIKESSDPSGPRIVLYSSQMDRTCWEHGGWRDLEVDCYLGPPWSPEAMVQAVQALWLAGEHLLDESGPSPLDFEVARTQVAGQGAP